MFFLLQVYATFAQQVTINSVVEKFDAYRRNTLQEKIFMHTDRTFYLTGETMWFKLYYRDASFNKPLSLSKVAYIELIDGERKSVLQAKIALTEGGGSGSLFLPASLNSGHYMLRAYTNWMKNFDADYFFQQAITVVNPFTKLGLTPQSSTISYDVQFFPEGGNLVNGLESVVGFRAVSQYGKGASFRGSILNENNDTITTFSSHKFGIGRFKFTPSLDHQYRAMLKDSTGRVQFYVIPKIQEHGYVIQVTDTLSDKIRVKVSARLVTQLPDPTLYLFMHSQHKNTMTGKSFLLTGKAEFIINKNDLLEGITHITLFDSNLTPLCDRLYFKEVSDKLSINLSLGQVNYLPRKKVDVSIIASDELRPASHTDMSVAVYKLDSLAEEEPQNIRTYMYLTSELKGTLESPTYYLQETKSTEKSIALDNLMLTHGWSRFHWKDIFNPSSTFDFIPENGGHIITATVKNIETDSIADRIVTYLSIPGKIIHLYVSKSNGKGIVTYEMQNLYGPNELIVQTNTTIDSIYRIQVSSPFSEKRSSLTTPKFDLSRNLKNALAQRSIHMQVQNVFYEKELSKYKPKRVDSVAFYGTPDAHYRLDDYTRFPTMEEVMREYVPGVTVRKRKDGFHFMNVDTPNKLFFREDPLVLIDGMPVFNIDEIMAFDPRKINTLDVMLRRYYLGPSSFAGVVSYKTYTNDLAGFKPHPKSLITNYAGLQLEQEFFSPRYDVQQRNSPMPDTRNLLYWSPALQTNDQGKSNLEFYTSDITGKFRIVVQGITSDGKPGSATAVFEVKDKLNY
jgi:hypothetical protein